MLNIVNLVGYAERNPELHYFKSGKVLCKLSISVKSDMNCDKTSFESIDLELWDRVAEIAAMYVSEGRSIGVSGSLKFSQLKEHETSKISQEPVVLVNNLYLLGSRGNKQLGSNSAADCQMSQHLEEFATELTTSFHENYSEDNEEDDEYETDFTQSYDEYDTSMDYGYLEDTESIYESFYSLGELD